MDIISFNEAATANGRIESFIENPDSTSGIVTVPKVIEAGENVTIPAGRVAVLPNVQVDGTLNIEGEVFIPSGATFDKVVEVIGNQNIDGVKTFTSSPIVPTPTAGDNSTKVATTAFVKAKSEADSIGIDQTWQNMTASRSIGVTYTNNTGKPIVAFLSTRQTANTATSNQVAISINGVVFRSVSYGITDSYGNAISAIIPNGSTYSYLLATNPTMLELR